MDTSHYREIWKGRPPIISQYQVFCAILYILRTGIPCYQSVMDSIHMRFQRGNERGLWWKILVSLQKEKKSKNECCHLVLLNIIVMVVVKKGETIQGQKYLRLNNKITFGHNIRLSNSRRIFKCW